MRGEWNVSIRRACGVFEMDTSTYHYKSRRPGQAHLEQRSSRERATHASSPHRTVTQAISRL
jgi:putative transposase